MRSLKHRRSSRCSFLFSLSLLVLLSLQSRINHSSQAHGVGVPGSQYSENLQRKTQDISANLPKLGYSPRPEVAAGGDHVNDKGRNRIITDATSNQEDGQQQQVLIRDRCRSAPRGRSHADLGLRRSILQAAWQITTKSEANSSWLPVQYRRNLRVLDNVLIVRPPASVELNEGLSNTSNKNEDKNSELLKQHLQRPGVKTRVQRVQNGQQAPDIPSSDHRHIDDNQSKSGSSRSPAAAAQQLDPDFRSSSDDITALGIEISRAPFSEEDREAKKADITEEVVNKEGSEDADDKKLIPDYNLGDPIKDWNGKRQQWAESHPEVNQEQLFIVTGTQPWPCHNPEGDHLLLRCFKNKVDYSRIHGVGLFYNTALLDEHMPTFWAKLPVVRATMLAHPEVEWIWWIDADAIITDMEFTIPLHRYSAYNLVVHGWESLIFEKRSWLGLNAGSFLLRNCQWSLELLERWASMGPQAPMGDAYRHILSDFLPDRPRNPTDDQAALVYLLIKERQRLASKLRVELEFFLSGYWLELMDSFEATEERYRIIEEQRADPVSEMLEREGTVGKEKLVAAVGNARQQYLSASGITTPQRRPFITHFTGCQPCSGHHNSLYSTDQCHHGLVRALNYADDQVLHTLGYRHRALHLPHVSPL